MMKNKFIIFCILSLFIASCSTTNPLKKQSKIISKNCPQSLILYQARAFEFDDASVEIPTGYTLNCYLIEQEGVVEISTNYSLNVSFKEKVKEKEKKIYNVNLIIFVTDQTKEIKIEEFQFSKELKIQDNDIDNFVFSYNDKIQIDLKTYNSGIKIFYAIN